MRINQAYPTCTSMLIFNEYCTFVVFICLYSYSFIINIVNMWTYKRTRKILSNTLGYFCVLIFFSLTTYIVFIFYSQIAPAVLENRKYGKFLFHFIFGNWLAMNIYFNYIMAWLTSPGLSKNYQNLSIQYPVCRKCSLSKPPRTHHCSWCDLCILRYDHHCPWLNNCVGFYNHRYFYQFCCFMSIGCIYAGFFGYREYQISLFDVQIFRHMDSFSMAGDILEVMGLTGFITYYIFVIGLGMGFLLLALSWWHGRMISRGETSVERLLNENYIQQYHERGFIFVETHGINRVENWKRFFGVRNIREFMRRILLPSTHKPKGNGVTVDNYEINTNSISHGNCSDEWKQYIPYGLSVYHSISGGYLVSKYRSKSASIQRQVISNDFISSYNPPTSLTDWKNNALINEI